ncbi:hypothetical protein LCGC14_1201620 [marine sediment metagenome]|uniref:Uncharacterized protein n=1 Tax=marine sediment metagenome TaxID=412755 RepID=A0A0F9M405_9ZZZZ
MSQEKVSFQEYVGARRNQIVLAYDGAKETALKYFDDIAQKWGEQLQINEAMKKTLEKNPVTPKVEKDKSRNKK